MGASKSWPRRMNSRRQLHPRRRHFSRHWTAERQGIRMLFREIATLSLEHLWLVAIAVVVATAIAAPGAVLLVRNIRVRRWTLGIVNVIQTIPSLALFGFLLPLPFIGGVGKHT